MTAPLIPVPIAPIGTRVVRAFVDYETRPGELREVATPVYPPCPQGRLLIALRLAYDLGLRQAATVLGLSPSDLSALEHGRATLVSDEEWTRLAERLAHASARRTR